MNDLNMTENEAKRSAYEVALTLQKEFGLGRKIFLFPNPKDKKSENAINYIARMIPEVYLVHDASKADAIICFSINASDFEYPSLINTYHKPVYALFGVANNNDEKIVTDLLTYVGENPERGGLRETPKRFIKAWEHFTKGYSQDPAEILKVFEDGAENCDEMVLVKDIPVYSQCEHHLVPFFGVAHVAYIPDGKIVGLSKISRVVDVFARRLQVQERLTNEISDSLWTNLHPLGVAVVLECRHLCMESRGISQQGSTTITSSMRGVFKSNINTRNEFMGFIK